MSRGYGRLYTSFWTHQTIKGFGADGRTLAAYLLTCEHSNMIGCYPLPHAYIMDDLSIGDDIWTAERVSEAFGKLVEKGWVGRFKDNRTICITQFIDPWNKGENPNVVKKMIALLDLLPKDPLKYFPAQGILSHWGKDGGDWLPKGERKRLETLCATLFETLPEQYRKPNLSEPIRTEPIQSVPIQKDIANGNSSAATTSSLGLEGRSEVAHSESPKKTAPSQSLLDTPAARAARRAQLEREIT